MMYNSFCNVPIISSCTNMVNFNFNYLQAEKEREKQKELEYEEKMKRRAEKLAKNRPKQINCI